MALRPLTVTARLRQGVAMTPPYDLDLAGILAARVRAGEQSALDSAGRLTRNPLPDTTGEDPADLDLPLARCGAAGDLWHWAASCATPHHRVEHQEPHTYFRSVDTDWARAASTRPLPYFHPTSGPYRDSIIPAYITVTGALVWRCIGDPHRVGALLAPIRWIGGKRAVGEGRVLSWHIEPVRVPARERHAWVHADEQGRLLRPVPPACATPIQSDHPREETWYAIRPPSWHRDRLHPLTGTIGGAEWAP